MAHARMQQPDDEIGVLQPPAGVRLVEPVNAYQNVAPYREIACLDAFPALRGAFAKRLVAERHERKPAIDVGASATPSAIDLRSRRGAATA